MRALLLTLLLLAPPAHAWNNYGHELVAARAWEQMTPKARARAAALLKLNPQYDWLSSGARPDEADKIAFMRAATWPDVIKLRDDYLNDGEYPQGPDAVRNIGYADHLMHRYWHYSDTPFSPDGTPLEQQPEPNARTQIELLRTALASPATSDDVKSFDLVWLLHLVGDIHQPLHAVSRFTAEHPQGDRGGNLVLLPCKGRFCDGPHHPQLHQFWDGLLGSGNDVRAVMRRAVKTKGRGVIPPADPKLAAVDDVTAWVAESAEAAKQSVYAPPVGPGAGPYKLDAAYRARARALAAERASLAAARLARLLNAALGG